MGNDEMPARDDSVPDINVKLPKGAFTVSGIIHFSEMLVIKELPGSHIQYREVRMKRQVPVSVFEVDGLFIVIWDL